MIVCDKTAHANYVKCFPAGKCFLNLHIGAKEVTPSECLDNSDLKRFPNQARCDRHLKMKSTLGHVYYSVKFVMPKFDNRLCTRCLGTISDQPTAPCPTRPPQ